MIHVKHVLEPLIENQRRGVDPRPHLAFPAGAAAAGAPPPPPSSSGRARSRTATLKTARRLPPWGGVVSHP
jgi:hypothetical protein